MHDLPSEQTHKQTNLQTIKWPHFPQLYLQILASNESALGEVQTNENLTYWQVCLFDQFDN